MANTLITVSADIHGVHSDDIGGSYEDISAALNAMLHQLAMQYNEHGLLDITISVQSYSCGDIVQYHDCRTYSGEDRKDIAPAPEVTF